MLREVLDPDYVIEDMAFSPAGDIFAAATLKSDIVLWEASSGKFLSEFSSHTMPVLDLEFSPDGRTIATVSDDGTIQIWGVKP
jgi:WD40 repeat protein